MKTLTDILTRWTEGSDAGSYRLIPRKVVMAESEEDILQLLAEARATGKPLTFKGGGTSLAGQALTDSTLVEIAPAFGRKPWVSADGQYATLPCNLTGAEANRLLKPYARKLGPAPASIHTARIGGIVANNASGPGWELPSTPYHTLVDMRIIFADGTLLDTSSEESRRMFFETHTSLLERLMNFRMELLCDPEMEQTIRRKYQLKNTCGYDVNALFDFTDPYDMLIHLMAGSEGTLGFISEVTFQTLPDPPFKASALFYFPSMREARRAIAPLRASEVSIVEWTDRQALRLVENEPGMPDILRSLPAEAVVLWVETEAFLPEIAEAQGRRIEQRLARIPQLEPAVFTTDPAVCAVYRQVCTRPLSLATARRPRGTSWMIEDIAFPDQELEAAIVEVRQLLAAYGYSGAGMGGHWLDGNVHFAFFPDLNHTEGVERYTAFMRKLAETVLHFGGTLRAGKGTGRKMAPFVRQEWGEKIYGLMKEIKRLFDPYNLLNPGVILSKDPEGWIDCLKPTPSIDERVDACIECGFCAVEENGSPARRSSTPRQRIVLCRALAELTEKRETRTARYKQLKKAFRAAKKRRIAGGGTDRPVCPVGIDTGRSLKNLRWKKRRGPIAAVVTALVRGWNELSRHLR